MRRVWANLSSPQRLRVLRASALVSVLITALGALLVFRGAHAAAVTVDEQVVPASTAVAAIWNTLMEVDDSLSGCEIDGQPAVSPVSADRDAAVNCATVLATGEYHASVADVVQRLAVLAANEISSGDGRQTIQVVQGTLISYLGLVDQAHYYLGQDQGLLAGAYLTYASGLLSDDVHAELEDYRATVLKELSDQDTSVYYTGWIALLWSIPLLASLALLVASQLYVAARFRRLVNPALATATLGLLLLGIGASQPLWSGDTFHDATSGLLTVVGASIPEDGPGSAPGAALVEAVDQAANAPSLDYLLPALTVALLTLIVIGFQARLDEYRLRSQ